MVVSALTPEAGNSTIEPRLNCGFVFVPVGPKQKKKTFRFRSECVNYVCSHVVLEHIAKSSTDLFDHVNNYT